jgi:DNA-binding response OmpR family regulator
MSQLCERKLKILMIEDNESSSDILRFILEREGYEVESAIDGREGEQKIHVSPPPDAVLLDASLPFVDGFQLIKLIRQSLRWKYVPIVMTSGHASKCYSDYAISLGADAYIVKPFQRNDLMQRIRRLTGQSTLEEKSRIRHEFADASACPTVQYEAIHASL